MALGNRCCYLLTSVTGFFLVLIFLVGVPAGRQGQTGQVTGVLRTGTGVPLEAVRVAVTPTEQSIADTLLESQGLTDSNGRYILENVSPGRYHILVDRGSLSTPHPRLPNLDQASLRSGSSTYHPGVTELSQATTIEVLSGSKVEVPDMVFSGQQVSGRVVDLTTGSGRRIESLVLCCDYSRPVLKQGNTPISAAAFKAALSNDGSFIFPFVQPGNYYLTTADPKVVPVSWALAVGESGVTGLRLEVTEGIRLTGILVDQAGDPMTAVARLRPKSPRSVFETIGPPTVAAVTGSLLLVPKEASSLDVLQEKLVVASTQYSASVGPDGQLAFKGVYPGSYVIEVSTTGVTLLEQEIQVGVTGPTNISFQVPAVRVTGRVTGPEGRPLPKLNYIRLVHTGANGEIFYGFPDSEGRFSLVLFPGSYRVFTENLGASVQSISDGSRDFANGEFILQDGRNQRMIVTLGP